MIVVKEGLRYGDNLKINKEAYRQHKSGSENVFCSDKCKLVYLKIPSASNG
jgi:hypothetical protein